MFIILLEYPLEAFHESKEFECHFIRHQTYPVTSLGD